MKIERGVLMKKLHKLILVVLIAAGSIFTAQETSAFFWKFFDNDDDYYRDYWHYSRYGGPYGWGAWPYGWGGPYGWRGPYGRGWGGHDGLSSPLIVVQSSRAPEDTPPSSPE
jgi:hypothetical protein